MSVASGLANASLWLTETASTYWMSALLYCLIAFITYCGYYVFIRPFLHPLRKIPGMPYTPLFGNIKYMVKKSGEMNLDGVKRLVKKYGNFFRLHLPFGGQLLMITDPDIMKQILVTNSKDYIKPRIVLIKLFEWGLGKGLIFLEGPAHAAHKRLMSPSFNRSSIKKMIPVFEEAGNRLAEYWIKLLEDGDEGRNKQLEIQNDLGHTTLDVIGKTAFGYDFNSLENPNDQVNLAAQGIIEAKDINSRMFIPGYFELPFPDVRRIKAAIKILHSKVAEVIENKRRLLETTDDLETFTRDILGKMMLAKDEDSGIGLTNEELKNEVFTLMAAGSETTSTGMAWFLLNMTKYPDIQTKCQEEIRQHLPSLDTPITWETLDKLTYLESTIKETLRMNPPVPTTIRTNLEADTFRGYHIPARSFCLLLIEPLMRSPDYFDDPDEFKPDRFFESEETNKNMYHFLPFLIGPRMCLGYKFAMLEMKTILACLLRKLTFEKIPGTSFVGSYKNRITFRPDPPLVLNAKLV